MCVSVCVTVVWLRLGCGGGVCGSGNSIGAEGARHLAEAFKSCPQLQSVGVAGECVDKVVVACPMLGWLQLLCTVHTHTVLAEACMCACCHGGLHVCLSLLCDCCVAAA